MSGRLLRIIAGTAIIVVGLVVVGGTGGVVLAIVGLVPLAAGIFNSAGSGRSSALTCSAGGAAPPCDDVAAATGQDVLRRGMRLAGAVGLVVLVPQIVHGVADVDESGGGRVAWVALAVLVGGGAVTAVLALAGRRAGARGLVLLASFWLAGAFADHPDAVTAPTGFRDGLGSAIPVIALVTLELLILLFAAAPAAPRRWQALKVDAAEAERELETGHAVLLDVRSRRERRADPRTGATATSWWRPEAAAGPAVVTCSHGGRSLVAARRLRAQGIEARSVAGGTRAWNRPSMAGST